MGHTNRWRLSTWLGTDLLGTSQAVRATVQIPPDDVINKVDLFGKYIVKCDRCSQFDQLN